MFIEHLPARELPRPASDRDRLGLAVLEPVACRSAREVADEDAVHRCCGLQELCCISHRSRRDSRLVPSAGDNHEREGCVDPHPDPRPIATVGDPAPNREGGPDGALWVVLVREGRTEHGEQSIPAEPLDHASAAFDLLPGRRVEGRGCRQRELRIGLVGRGACDADGEHGDELALPSSRLWLDVLARPVKRFLVYGRRGEVEAWFLPEDGGLKGLELPTRLDPELLDEPAAGVLVRRKRLRLPTAPVQGEHQLSAQSLSERLAGDKRLEFADELHVTAELQIRLHAILERLKAELLDASALGHSERLVCEVGERATSKQPERLAEQPRGVDRVPSSCCVPQRLETVEVEILR